MLYSQVFYYFHQLFHKKTKSLLNLYFTAYSSAGLNFAFQEEFFESFHAKKGVTPLFIAAHQKFFSNFKYQESPFPDTRKSYVDLQLNHCRHVFIRNDAVRSPLHPTYDGPFKVLYPTPKYFKVVKNCKEYTVSVNRLKTANLLTDFLHSDDCLKNNKKSVSGKQHHFF